MREPAVTATDIAHSSALPQRSDRKTLDLRGFLQRADGTIIDVQVEDLSFDGCRLKTPTYLWPKERIHLSVPKHAPINGTVRWCCDGFAGVEFDALTVEEKKLIPRREQRLATDADVTLRRIGLSSFRVTVRDISLSGCKIELVERPRTNETVLVKIDNLEALDGAVRWVDGFTAGVEFSRPIHPAVFNLLKPRLKVGK